MFFTLKIISRGDISELTVSKQSYVAMWAKLSFFKMITVPYARHYPDLSVITYFEGQHIKAHMCTHIFPMCALDWKQTRICS